MEHGRMLEVDGLRTGQAVGVAERWWARARGLLPGKPWPPLDVLKLPRCRAVHTFGMRVPIDVLFSDADGRVTSIRTALPPWRVVRDGTACTTWEMRSGAAARLGLRIGSRLRAVDRIHGATALEFLLAAVLVVIPLCFAVLETAQLAVTRHVLQQAVNEAARQAAVSDLSDFALRRSLGLGLLPLFVPLDPRAPFAASARPGVPRTLEADAGLEGLARAYGEAFRPDLSSVDLEALDDDGRVWRLRVRYCRDLHFPLVREAIPEVLRWGTASPFEQACLARRRLPLEAWALLLRRGTGDRAPGGLPQLPPTSPGEVPDIPPPGDGGGGGGGGGGRDEGGGPVFDR
jgi:uncharacterized membrane protein (UPF0127 family)